MCGRFTLKEKFLIKNKYRINIDPSYNIYPSKNVLILNKNLKPIFLTWSFSPYWSKKAISIINARNETLNEKSSFKDADKCIFIADGYFEWKRTNENKIPFYHHLNGDLMFFGGIYNENGCCIVTKEAHKKISFIHTRQPILLYEEDLSDWVNNNYFCNSDITNDIKFHRVNYSVNNPTNNNKNIIKPICEQL